jgi:hypothetical protein
MFWVVGAIALLWNLLGVWAYVGSVTATPEQLEGLYNEEQLALILATPNWAVSATAIAVTAGVIGSILLLLRNRYCIPVFIVSLIAIVVQDIYIFGMTNSVEAFGMQPIYMQGLVLLIGIFLVWYSTAQKQRGVIR